MSQDRLMEDILALVDESDFKEDSTLQSADELAPLVEALADVRNEINVIAALGSGSGGFISALGSFLDATEIHAVDRNRGVLNEASDLGLETHQVDLERGSVPLANGTVDLIVSLGLLEHLSWYDNVIAEISRMSSPEGFCLFAVPNMAGWTNRLSLLTGHQPRNVEFSKKKPFGIMNAYGSDYTVGHVHAPTVGAFREFLEYHDFEIVDTVGLHPYQEGRLVPLVDKLVSRRPSLCRRFAVLGQYQPDR